MFSSHSLEARESQEKGNFCAACFLLLYVCECVTANVVYLDKLFLDNCCVFRCTQSVRGVLYVFLEAYGRSSKDSKSNSFLLFTMVT